MSEHTPGPWRVSDRFDSDGRVLPSDSYLPVADTIGWQSRSLAELKANARLIAAAPELLETLKRLVVLSQDDSNEPIFAWRHAFAAAAAVVAKAEGVEVPA